MRKPNAPFMIEKKCYQKFIEWAKSNRYIVNEHDFTDEDLVWSAWRKAWVISRAVTAEQYNQEKRAKLKRLTDEEKRKLWINCSTGKDYAERIETALLRRTK